MSCSKAAIVAVALLIGACTTTPQGKSLDRSNYADMASTALALTIQESAREANPLGYVLIPLKLGFGRGIEKTFEDCWERAYITGKANSVFYGLTGNNLAVAAGVTLPWSLIIGGVVGTWYYWSGYHLEPDDVWECDSGD